MSDLLTSTTWTKPLLGFRLANTRGGDTLQAVAARELGDAASWPDLVALNGLVAPYLTDDPLEVAPGVLLAGDVIRVPSTASDGGSGVADPSDIYGADLDLVGGFLNPDANGDLAGLSGPANLQLALEIVLDTEQGSLPFHPSFGTRLEELVGKGNDESVQGLALGFANSAVRSDPRISTTQSSTATVSGDAVVVFLEAVTVAGRVLPIGGTTAASGAAGAVLQPLPSAVVGSGT